MGIVIDNKYYEKFVFSDSPEKDSIMSTAFIRETELKKEQDFLVKECGEWNSRSWRFPNLDDTEYKRWKARLDEIEEELNNLLEGTNVTKEEYKEAKKNLEPRDHITLSFPDYSFRIQYLFLKKYSTLLHITEFGDEGEGEETIESIERRISELITKATWEPWFNEHSLKIYKDTLKQADLINATIDRNFVKFLF